MTRMKLLVAFAILFFAVVDAHHTQEHTLRGPRFSVGKVHVYEVEFNVTAGVKGLSSQVSKSALKAELQVYAKSENEHILKVTKVYTSGSVKAVESQDGPLRMQKSRELEDRLSTPIKFTMESGKVTSYTLSSSESLESKKIKMAILRSLEMHVPEEALRRMESSNPSLRIPVSYNITKDLSSGPHTSHYLITVSPNVEFPYDNNVYNISRSENFEGERYPAHKFHHNFRQQGCPSVCGSDQDNSGTPAGCPAGFESHQSPMKTYVHHQHHLALEYGNMSPEIIQTTELHTAKMYDQDMEVLITQRIRKIGHTRNAFEASEEQTSHSDLYEVESEADEKEVNAKCGSESSREAAESAKSLLKEIAHVVVQGDLDSQDSRTIGEKTILLKAALSKLQVSELKQIAADIVRRGSLKTANEEERVKRQIWMDILPLIGTPESVSFIVNYIKENIERELLTWEAKEILEALPENIHNPSERNIRELRTLLDLSKTRSSHLLHSAAHSCLARVISSLCNSTESDNLQSLHTTESAAVQDLYTTESPRNQPVLRLLGRNQNPFRSLRQSSNPNSPADCPVELVSEILKEITQKLRNTKKHDEIVIYVETLARTGISDVLPIISEYAYGTAENIQEFSPSYIEFVKSSAVYSLHDVVSRHPEEVQSIIMPLFFNETETPKLRTAAFGVLIRSQPSLEILQHVAVRSWREQSKEVGSFVTSTLDTFGNTTLPCLQLTAHRIKQVMPMVKRFDNGIQHAKNLHLSYFDDNRMFGVNGHLSYTPSNASIFPSAMYQALSYSTDSLSDSVIQTALNIEGLTQRRVYEFLDQHILGISPNQPITPSKEDEIFEQAKVASRIPETLRFTLYKRMFYSSSFYYLDLSNLKTQVDTLKQYLEAYLMRTSFDISGHLVKLYMPSSFHTVTIAKTLPYPVEFQMHQPIVIALKIESKERNPSLPNFHFLIRPSVYLSKLYTNQLKNVHDCKEIGVYHEHKIAISYPVQVKFIAEGLRRLTVNYKLPELPKRILYYFTESGTYAGKKSLETLASSEDREPIRTLPAPFKTSTTIHTVGIAPMQVESHTEEIGLMSENLPSSLSEMVDFAVKQIMNAGWRYKAVNLTIVDDSSVWPKDTEVIFNIHYGRNHVTKSKLRMRRQQESSSSPKNVNHDYDFHTYSPEDEYPMMTESLTTESPEEEQSLWSQTTMSPQKWFWNKDEEPEDDSWYHELKRDDISNNKNPTIFVNQAKRIASKLSSLIPHIYHELEVQISTKPVNSKAFVRMEYNHTHTMSLHAVHIDAAVKHQNERVFRKISIDHLMGFLEKPDEFQYDKHNDEHLAVMISALRSHPLECSCPWKDVEVVAKAIFQYEPLDSLLNDELETNVERKYYLSETHDQCLKDVKNGHSQSIHCLKAIRERSIYNKLKMSILWNKNLPQSVRNWAKNVDTYMKHVYYKHMFVNYEPNTENRILVDLNHIDKLTDKPVCDVTIQKPQETVTYRRVRTIGYALDDPLSSVHGVLGVDSMVLTNNTYPPTCVMMEKYLRTYDLKSYPLSLDQCNYVLSAHCSDYKNFAIIAKILSSDGTKEIHIYVGPHTLVLSPLSSDHYTVNYNDQDYTISEPVVFDEDSSEIYAFSEQYPTNHKHLEVVARKAGIRVIYDGKNVKVQISPRYKGETCGLCSEFDGETMREFRGIDRCLYSHPTDFVNSAITNKETCKKQPLHPFICETETSLKSADSEYVPSIKRNVVIGKGNEICFSVRPVPVCQANDKPVSTESMLVGFHCLPKQDITARRMISESKRRSLGEIENKSIDHEEPVEVAKTCTHAEM